MHAVGSWLDLWLEDSGHGAQDGPEQVKRGGKAEMLTVLWQRETEAKNERSCPKPPKVVGAFTEVGSCLSHKQQMSQQRCFIYIWYSNEKYLHDRDLLKKQA